MNNKITAHEPDELLASSVDEAFQEAEESKKLWQEWERVHQIKTVRIEVPQAEYNVLETLALQQGKTVAQLIQTLLDSKLATLIPPSQVHFK